jgi:hypothetical protein
MNHQEREELEMTYTFDEYTISDSQSFWGIFAASNADQKQAIWDDLCDTLKETVAYENQQRALAVERFEHLIADLVRCGAKDFNMAIKWLHEVHDTYGEDDYLEYMLGLPYKHIVKARIAAYS